jgi:hypothetical protein
MNQTTTDLRAEIMKLRQSLETLRDEVRVRIHLGAMDAKDAWKKIETQIAAAEDAAEHASESSREALKKALQAVKQFRASLEK